MNEPHPKRCRCGHLSSYHSHTAPRPCDVVTCYCEGFAAAGLGGGVRPGETKSAPETRRSARARDVSGDMYPEGTEGSG